jgi:PTH2 family peptidyl-tRNA hydrolase
MLFLLERLSHAGSVGAPIFSDLERAWMRGPMTKVCVRVDSEEALQAVIRQAQQEGLVVHTVTDSGRTEFKGVPTLTCCAIGPAPEERIDAITGGLGLL